MIEHGFLAASEESRRKYSTDFVSKPDWRRRTLATTIEYDDKIIMAMHLNRVVDISDLNRFLLAGCASPVSLHALENLVETYKEQSSATVVVADISPIALNALQPTQPPSEKSTIARYLVQADLRKAVFAEGSMDYVRMDYLQNFVNAESQLDLLSNLARSLSPHGTIVSSVDVLNANDQFKNNYALPSEYLGSGTYYHRLMKFRCFVPSAPYIERVAEEAGLSVHPLIVNNRDHLTRYFEYNPDAKPKPYPTGAVLDDMIYIYRRL